MAAPKKPAGKSMDIQKPGEAAPNNSSRPLIVTSRPIMQDPMLTEASDKPEPETEAAPKEQKSMTTSAKTIEPPKSDDPAVAGAEVDPSEDEEDKPLAPATDSIDPSSTTSSNEAAVVDAVVNASPSLSTEQKADEADEKRKQAAQVLIDSKKYVVPIGQVSRARKTRHLIWLLVFIVLITAGYVVADMGLVALPFELPIDLIK